MVEFEKWQGLGNDFIVLEGEDPGPTEAVRLCHRRTGIGADGVLAVSEHASGVRMVVRNADGSRPEMCGNGVRCVVGFLAMRGRLERGAITIVSDAGERECAFEKRADGTVLVSVGMGRATVLGPMVTPQFPERAFVRVEIGNPHAVSFAPFDEGDLERVGPALERDTPGGINVELCRLRSARHLEVRVWERGVGRTLACGTGACAVAAAAARAGLVSFDAPILVELPGGALEIVVDGSSGAVTMRGPAEFVFRGRVDGAAAPP